jgi:hypothetical protein
MRPDLYRMFYPLPDEEQDRWAEIVRLPSATAIGYPVRAPGVRVTTLCVNFPWRSCSFAWKPSVGRGGCPSCFQSCLPRRRSFPWEW